jgi:hypothetical protein
MSDFGNEMSVFGCQNDITDMLFELLAGLMNQPQSEEALMNIFNSIQGRSLPDLTSSPKLPNQPHA